MAIADTTAGSTTPAPTTAAAHDADKLVTFVSYSRDDLAFADQLVVTLELAGFAPTIDRIGIHGAENWEDRLRALIAEADTLVFVLSPTSAVSKVCTWEVAEAVRLNKRIIPVLKGPLGDVAAPPALAALNYIFLYDEPMKPGSGWASGMRELVAALKTDLGWLRDHTRYLQRASEWERGGRQPSRMLAGTDILEAKGWIARRPREAPPPTDVQLAFIAASEAWEAEQTDERRRQLEERERLVAEQQAALNREAAAQAARETAQKEALASARRVTQRTLAGLVAAVVLAGAAGWFGLEARRQANVAKGETARAEEQTRQAVAQKARAEAAIHAGSRVANGLVFDLAQKFQDLRGVPQTLIRDVLERARGLTEELAKGSEPPPELLHTRAAALDELARAFQKLGDGAKALEAARASLAIVEKLAAAHPERLDWQSDMAVSLERTADVLQDAGNAEGALANYRRSLAMRETLATAYPERADWQRDVSVSLERIGNMLKAAGNAEGALANYRRSLAIAETLAAAHPDRPDWQRNVSVSLDKIADMLRTAGNADGALANYRRSLAIAESLAAAHPDRPDWQRDVAVSLDKIADVLKTAGNAEGALANYRRGLAIRETLAATNPDQPQFATDLAVSYIKLADIGIDAQANLTKAQTILHTLAAKGHLTAAQQTWLPIVEAKLAELPWRGQFAAIQAASKAGRHDEALRIQREVAAEIEAAEARTSGKAGPKTASALGTLAWHALLAREPAEALSAAERARAIDPTQLWMETNRALALMYLGRADEARALFLAYKDKRVADLDDKPWPQAVGEDFATFRKAGLEHPQMAEIETALGIAR